LEATHVIQILRLLHLLAMSSWLAGSLWLSGDARRALPAGPAEARAFVDRAHRALGLDRWAGAVTILSGLLLLMAERLWPAIRPGLWLGMALALARAGLSDALLRPTLRRIEAGLDAGQSPASLAAEARRLGALSGAGHVAWLLALCGMVLPF
jgi:hypothetical protein